MSHVTIPRPTEPYASRNPFREQSYKHQVIPSFLEARQRLPIPVLPERPEWVEMYWRAWEIAWSNLRRPKPGSGFVSNFIDAAAANDHIFMADSAFMVQFGLYARRLFDFMGTLNNFYGKQHPDGFICREIDVNEGFDLFYPFDPNSTGPNILAWAEWRYFRASGDDGRLSQVFGPLMALHRWLRANRTWQSGLYWATGLSSGMTNQPRVPDSMNHHRHWAWVDTSMQAALNCQILGYMAALLQEEAAVAELAEERATLIRLINEQMWNDDVSFYQDIDPKGHFSRVKSIGAYWGLLDRGLIPDERLTPFIQHLRDSWSFKLPHRIPSQSADSDGYNAQTGHSWRGGVWSPTNFMVLKGLRTVGQDLLAHEIALNHITNVCDVYIRTDTFWENYAPEMAEAGQPARPNFVGWTGLTPISILLEDVIGISVDWPLRRVTWDRRLDTTSQYGVQSYPLGPEGTAELVGDHEKVTVTTDVPFTLTIRDREQTLQAAIPIGTTEIDLT